MNHPRNQASAQTDDGIPVPTEVLDRIPGMHLIGYDIVRAKPINQRPESSP